jgi:hypothetical protein
MSINKLISIRNPILNAMDMAALDHDKHLPLFMTWAYQAETEIGSYYQFERQWAVLDICGGTAELPDNCIRVEGAIMGSHPSESGSIFSKVFSNPIVQLAQSTNNTFLIVDAASSETTTGCGIIPYGYQNNKIIFDVAPNNGNVTIEYIGYSIDCDGFMQISENHIEAITHHILYKWCLRKRKKTSADMSEMQWHFKEWDRLCAHSRALDSQLTETEREEIARLWHDPYSGRGLYVGMNINNTYGRFSY